MNNARPHPGLLPQEKENHLPRSDNEDALGGRASFTANGKMAEIARATRELHEVPDCCSLSPGERVRVRASVKTILHSSLLLCLALVSPLRADDTITEVMSPIASYVYCEWPGDDVLQLRTSPWVSYYYPGLDGPQIVLHGRVTGAGGAPLAGATVSAAWGTLPVASTSTAANGTYALPLGAGVYALTAGAPGYAPSARVLTLSAGTAPQDFQLNALPAAPDQLETVRSPVVNHSTGPPGELKMFDGVSFVAITGGNAPQLDRMTIVLTHGFNSNPEEWASGLAAQMRDAGVTAEVANILCWDWRAAAVPLAEAYGQIGRAHV